MSYYGPGQANDPWPQAGPPSGYADASYSHSYLESGPVRSTGSSRALLAVLVTVLVLVICGGGIGGLYLLGAHTGSPDAGSTRTATPPAGPSFNPKAIAVGDCLAIAHPDDSPQLGPGGCSTGNYQVVKRINGTGDKTLCQGVNGANSVYFYQTTPDSDSFVLCLHKL
jgi:hypothetical protein